MKRELSFVIVLLMIVIATRLSAQPCQVCTYVINGSNDSVFTVNANEVFCLNAAAKFTGTLTLNGGTICNLEHFKPKVFTYNSGAISNYMAIIIPGDHNLNNGKSISSETKSFMRVLGVLSVSGGTFLNKGIISVKDSLNYASGSFVNQGVVSCKGLVGETYPSGQVHLDLNV